jgi:hypothetical protein
MPKNIVLLSDGTGNSAAKLFKTNVWRIYDCLDLRSPDEQLTQGVNKWIWPLSFPDLTLSDK